VLKKSILKKAEDVTAQ